jgi:signal transduction histidine kinase
LRVRDEGPGLDEQGRGRAFDRFWRGRGCDRALSRRCGRRGG